MISIRCRLKKPIINIEKLNENAQKLLTALDYTDYDLGILITTKKTVQHYNNQFRNINKPTDILSFPYHVYLKPPHRIKVENDDDKNLGDIIICPAYILENLTIWNQSFEERVDILLVHGICHLIGYDHVTDKEFAKMNRKEKELLGVIKK